MTDTFTANVAQFMRASGQTVGEYNVRQTALYIGLVLEETAEMLEAIGLHGTAGTLHERADMIKRGEWDAHIRIAGRQELLDAHIDSCWVHLGAAFSQGADVRGAQREVSRANLDKIVDGAVQKDANGKVRKPAGWRGPDLSQFVRGAL